MRYAAIVALFLVGCSSIPDYKHDGVTEQKYQADYTECLTMSGEAHLKKSARPRFVQRCMIGKGYSGEEM